MFITNALPIIVYKVDIPYYTVQYLADFSWILNESHFEMRPAPLCVAGV
jgi:hypothetical protein